jgi:hypothetical protein
MSDKNDVVFGSWTGSSQPIWDEIEITTADKTGTAIYVPKYSQDVLPILLGATLYLNPPVYPPPYGFGVANPTNVTVWIYDPPDPPNPYGNPYKIFVQFNLQNNPYPNPIVPGQLPGFAVSLPDKIEWKDLREIAGKQLFVSADAPIKATLMMNFTSNITRG